MRLAAATVLVAFLAASGAAQPTWTIGAAKVEITPPLFDPAADAAMFPLCPSAVFSGPRIFGLQEPYIDQDASGLFNYESDAYCDANLNGRYDGMYSAGGIDHLLEWVHDPIFARAFSVSDGAKTLVVVSIESIGLFENQTKRMRAAVLAGLPPGANVATIFSADHNESSPDSIGLYGAPDNGLTGGFSGINDYYMEFLVERAAAAALNAIASAVPGRLRMAEALPPADVPTRLSHNFPTTNDDETPAAINPKLRVLQGVTTLGAPVFTVLSLSAHNQQVGHAGDGETVLVGGVPKRVNRAVSGDWPGAFHAHLESQGIGLPIFLVGDNGSIEDPAKEPEVPGTFDQAAQTGVALGDAVLAALPAAAELPYGPIVADRVELFVPLENNLFRAAGAAGLFGDRQLYTAGQPTGRVGNDVLTEVSVVDVGPELQLLAHPSESFPALAIGSPWGIEEASCPGDPGDPIDRSNPEVPAWHARARHRVQIGLANDLIGYLIPAWGWSAIPAVTDSTCFNDQDDVDPRGHQHKLETEGVGPSGGNIVANNLAALLDQRPDPVAHIRLGRFVLSDGSLSRRAAGAIGIRLARPGSTELDPCEDTFVALPGTGTIGGLTPDAFGGFMDFDGQAQPAPDLLTRGMWAGSDVAAPDARYYVNVYPALAERSDCAACATCDDGLACNGVETCGVPSGCVPGTPIDCSNLDDQCRSGACVEPGSCEAAPVADGTPCMANGDTCSVADTCQGGFCRAGGGGDTDGDLVCDADDVCPLVPDPGQDDLDGDGRGDPCDDADATLILTRAKISARGTISVRGIFGPPMPGDHLSTENGIAARVTDGSGVDAAVSWPASECSSTGSYRCRTADGAARIRIKPGRRGIRFSLQLRRLALQPPFAPPVGTTITNPPIDRVGTITACSSTDTMLRCRQ